MATVLPTAISGVAEVDPAQLLREEMLKQSAARQQQQLETYKQNVMSQIEGRQMGAAAAQARIDETKRHNEEMELARSREDDDRDAARKSREDYQTFMMKARFRELEGAKKARGVKGQQVIADRKIKDIQRKSRMRIGSLRKDEARLRAVAEAGGPDAKDAAEDLLKIQGEILKESGFLNETAKIVRLKKKSPTEVNYSMTLKELQGLDLTEANNIATDAQARTPQGQVPDIDYFTARDFIRKIRKEKTETLTERMAQGERLRQTVTRFARSVVPGLAEVQEDIVIKLMRRELELRNWQGQ